MKELELRLALVFYGGVSLAIYMHGVSREVLHLVRASAGRSARNGRKFDTSCSDRPLSPTEQAYQDLLERIGRTIDVRVVADAIAGASAGGVNGIMLARALAHDLPLDSHKGLWLKNADVTRLARPQNGFSRYLKTSVAPVLDRLISRQLKKQIENSETREKLRVFMQSRWFTPPFSGSRYISWMLDACKQMDDHLQEGATLIPRGQMLDLFVTLTDYYGQKRRIDIDDPNYIEELDHRRILNFHAMHRVRGELRSQFGSECIPEMVFAARATSSFPGAFVPATIQEMDHVLKKQSWAWPNRTAFLDRGLDLPGKAGENRYFVDGSVVMNKPFGPVIDVITQRPAAREVARRLVYIDPSPGGVEEQADAEFEVPGFFRTILASMAHIPRNEPIGDELRDIEARNRRGRWLSETIAAADPVVEKEVRALLPSPKAIDAVAMTKYRKLANAAAHEQAGYAFLNYQSLKLHAVSERLAELIIALARTNGHGARQDALTRLINDRFADLAKTGANGPPKPDDPIVGLLRGLDVDYRIRRMRFVIRKLNALYATPVGDPEEPNQTDRLDNLKSRLYQQIDNLAWRWKVDFFGEDTRKLAEEFSLSVAAQLPPEIGTDRTELLDNLLTKMTGLMGLEDLDRMQDEIFSELTSNADLAEVSRKLTEVYVGFSFYDLVIFPVLQRNDFSEVSEILVDRISPRDPGTLSPEGFELKGEALNSFGAFFNRSWREHDYLWGRLNAADRLVSIVLSAAGPDTLTDEEETACRHRLFRAILEEEEDELLADPSLVPLLKARLVSPRPDDAPACDVMTEDCL